MEGTGGGATRGACADCSSGRTNWRAQDERERKTRRTDRNTGTKKNDVDTIGPTTPSGSDVLCLPFFCLVLSLLLYTQSIDLSLSLSLRRRPPDGTGQRRRRVTILARPPRLTRRPVVLCYHR